MSGNIYRIDNVIEVILLLYDFFIEESRVTV